jgi:hypothetical protein
MPIAGKDNGRFLTNKVTENFNLVDTNNFHYYDYDHG